MSFSRVNPGGWGVGAQLTSAQQNSLDIDHANALDKTVAGDVLAGVVNLNTTGQISSNTSFGVIGTTAKAIAASVASGIVSNTPGGIGLGGGASDWPTFAPVGPRTRTLCASLTQMNVPAGWSIGGNGWLIAPGTAANAVYLSLPRCHNGATLSTIGVMMVTVGPHSGVPVTLPTLTVYRLSLISGGTHSSVFLSSTAVQSFTPAPGSGAAWDNSGLTQLLVYSCNQNNVIDNSQYAYTMALTDEGGAGAVAGNLYLGTVMSYTAIADMRFA